MLFLYLLLARSNALRIQVPVRMQVTTAGSLYFDCDLSTISHFSWHAGIVEWVPDQLRLESRTVEPITVPTVVEKNYEH